MRKVSRITVVILMICLLTSCQLISESSRNTQTKESREHIMNKQFINAVENQDENTILDLIEQGAEINSTNEQGQTAVMIATHNNDPDIVKILIDQGADINIRDHNKDNVLLYAGAAGFLEIVKLAIKNEADTALTNRYGGIAIIPASERGHVEVVEYLTKHSDTDVNHINDLHWTALLEAIILGDGSESYQKIVGLLLEHGADVTIGDREGITPLEHAEKRNFKEIEKLLKKAGA